MACNNGLANGRVSKFPPVCDRCVAEVCMCVYAGGHNRITRVHVQFDQARHIGTHTDTDHTPTRNLNRLKTFTLPLDADTPDATLQALPGLIQKLLEGLSCLFLYMYDG